MKKKVLLISPHTDDVELSMGGTAHYLASAPDKFELHHAVLTVASVVGRHQANQHLPLLEWIAAQEWVGTSYLYHSKVDTLDVRTLPTHRQEVLEYFLSLKKLINPDIVFVPSQRSTHQDHEVVTTEAFRAFKHCTLYGYEEPWNNLSFAPTLFVSLSKKNVDGKLAAISCFRSQSSRYFFEESKILSWLEFRGMQINREYAESFEIIRQIGIGEC